jgi:lambda repressor-like predicted transcriptional regulator
MAIAERPNPAAELLVDNVRTFLHVRNAYDQCGDEIKKIVDEMVGIFSSQDATDDEKQRALLTIVEALFPSLAVDYLDYCESLRQSVDSRKQIEEMAEQERVFAERVQEQMQKTGMTQDDLAQAVGVGQPAISNMLVRQCRPQRRTVIKIAKALGVDPEQLWPGIKSVDSD